MKLTEKEKEICERYSARDETGHVHCNECPLNIGYPARWEFMCYAIIDGRTSEARGLKRYE